MLIAALILLSISEARRKTQDQKQCWDVNETVECHCLQQLEDDDTEEEDGSPILPTEAVKVETRH